MSAAPNASMHRQRKLLEAAITALIHARRCTNFGGLLETRSGFNAVSALHDLLGDVNLGELVEEIGDVIAPPEGDASNPYGLTAGERGRVL